MLSRNFIRQFASKSRNDILKPFPYCPPESKRIRDLLNPFPDRSVNVVDNRKEKKSYQQWLDSDYNSRVKPKQNTDEKENKTSFVEVRHQGLLFPVFFSCMCYLAINGK